MPPIKMFRPEPRVDVVKVIRHGEKKRSQIDYAILQITVFVKQVGRKRILFAYL